MNANLSVKPWFSVVSWIAFSLRISRLVKTRFSEENKSSNLQPLEHPFCHTFNLYTVVKKKGKTPNLDQCSVIYKKNCCDLETITSSSERYISSQLENIKSSDSSSNSRSEEVTSAHLKLAFLKWPLLSSFCNKQKIKDQRFIGVQILTSK